MLGWYSFFSETYDAFAADDYYQKYTRIIAKAIIIDLHSLRLIRNICIGVFNYKFLFIVCSIIYCTSTATSVRCGGDAGGRSLQLF